MLKVGLHLMCSKLLPFILLELSPFVLSLYYSKIILRRYTCIRNTSFKTVESKIPGAGCKRKQGTI